MTGKIDSRTDSTTLAREYYQALDNHDYETLESLLAAEFAHQRPDMTLEGRERFVQFMRSERPNTETSHAIDGVYETSADGMYETSIEGAYENDATEQRVVRGRLLDEHDEQIVGFVDVFWVADERIQRLRTYTE